MSYEGLVARLVWEGTDEVRIPPEMGTPREDQMQGTARERLVELAGRVCYDSLGTGRASVPYHGNIIEINHGALWEHAVLTVECSFDTKENLLRHTLYCLNRPSLFVDNPYRNQDEPPVLRLTLNLRHLNEWIKGTRAPGLLPAGYFGWRVHEEANHLAPNVLDGSDLLLWRRPTHEGRTLTAKSRDTTETLTREAEVRMYGLRSVKVVEPETDEEKWITLFLSGSRGFSHELVRHGDWTAISQRSTRYVDESESAWVIHPLTQEWISQHPYKDVVRTEMRKTIEGARACYDGLVKELQRWLEGRIDKFSARKQARGAARGFLGNALSTEVIFSASVAQWRHMLRMRLSDAADAEIRDVFALALEELKRSRYGDRFQEFLTAPAKDGIGVSLIGGGAK